MKIITYFSFMQWDGCDRHYKKEPHFYHEDDMKRFMEDKQFDIYDKTTVHVHESFEEYEKIKSKSFKESALAKLTDDEKVALGLVKDR